MIELNCRFSSHLSQLLSPPYWRWSAFAWLHWSAASHRFLWECTDLSVSILIPHSSPCSVRIIMMKLLPHSPIRTMWPGLRGAFWCSSANASTASRLYSRQLSQPNFPRWLMLVEELLSSQIYSAMHSHELWVMGMIPFSSPTPNPLFSLSTPLMLNSAAPRIQFTHPPFALILPWAQPWAREFSVSAPTLELLTPRPRQLLAATIISWVHLPCRSV